jgi:hypothetical protein
VKDEGMAKEGKDEETSRHSTPLHMMGSGVRRETQSGKGEWKNLPNGRLKR